ncbi:LuxR C-terminal-related transcriptional regulator [Streptomyces sp. NPDC101175]|uniref:helix-turn-helix transcriptional regulator n=1 Tax=Streptomyces sp. NPDC101175 TaxID=3366123 RepID=UPI00383309C2
MAVLPGNEVAGARRVVGREAEVAALARALDGLTSGVGRAIALVGEPGIGKSVLLRAAVARARAGGVRVLDARGPGTLPETDAWVRHDVSAHSARRPPLVVAVDDLHHLDADRIPDVERLIDAAAGPLLCLLAYRQRQLSPALAAVLSRAASADLLEVWNVGPLSLEQARELLGDLSNADGIHREALGNPQYLKVLAAHGKGSGSAGGEDDDVAGTDAGMAILGELAGLDALSLDVVQTAAVLGESFHPELLAEIADLEATQVMRALDTLTRLDLVRPVGSAAQLALRHRAVAEIVYQRLEPSRRTALHRSTEAALTKRAAPIVRRAHHAARAAHPGRPEHATTLIAAAHEAQYTDPAVAADHLRVALSLLQDGDPLRYQAQVLLARTQLLSGEASESRALLDALRSAIPGRSVPDPSTLAEASRIERRLGRVTEAGAIARAALADLTDTATAAALHTELADYAYDMQEYDISRHHAQTAAAIAHRNGDAVGEAKALAQAALAHLYSADQATALTTAARAAELIDAASDAVLLTNLAAAHQLGMTEGILGRFADAERHLARGAELSRRTGQTYMQRDVLTSLANAQLRSGHLIGALATLDETAHHMESLGGPVTRAVIAMLRAEILYWLGRPGDREGAVESAERAVAVADGSPHGWALTVRCFHAEFELLNGEAARATWLLLDATGGTELPKLTIWRKPRCCDTLAQAALTTGDRASVEHWARLAESCVEQLPSSGRLGYARRARMRAHAAAGDIERAVDSAREAFAHFSSGGERIEAGRTLFQAAALCLDAGWTEGVDGWLERAAGLAQQCGSVRLAQEVALQRGRLAAPGDAPGALTVLTARERQIAELASTGITSGEIAEALVLSVRTVESHLGRIYRKLDVPNRASLTRAVLSNGSPAPGAQRPASG